MISKKNGFFFRTGPPWTSQVPETGSRFFFRRNIDSRFGVDFLFDGMLESRFRFDFLFDGKLEIRFWLDFLCDGALEFWFRQDFMSDGMLEASSGCFSYVPEDQSRWKEEVGAIGEESDGHLSQRQVFCELCTSRERFLASCKQCKQGHGSSLVISLGVSREAIILP